MKYIGKFFAVIFSIIYMAFLIAFISLNYSKNLLSGDFYSNILKSVDFSQIKVSDIANTFDGIEHYEDATLEDIIVEGLTDGGMSEEQAKGIVENENVKNVVGNLIGEMVEYGVNGGDIPTISNEDIKALVTDPELNIEGEEFTDEEIEEVTNQLNDIINQLLTEGVDENAE